MLCLQISQQVSASGWPCLNFGTKLDWETAKGYKQLWEVKKYPNRNEEETFLCCCQKNWTNICVSILILRRLRY